MKKLTRIAAASTLTLALGLGLSACGSDKSDADAKAPASTSSQATTEKSGEAKSTTFDESDQFKADMQKAVDTVKEQLAKDSNQTQMMIANDVDQPTEKYGMWVLPFYPSDATKKFTMQIQIKDGKNFKVTLVSAASGKTWSMDQDGNITEGK